MMAWNRKRLSKICQKDSKIPSHTCYLAFYCECGFSYNISSDAGEQGVNRRVGSSSQWDPQPDEDTGSPAASESFLLSCVMKRCSLLPRRNFGIGSSVAHLVGQLFSLLEDSGLMSYVSFLSLRNCQPAFVGFCIVLQSWEKVGQVHGEVMGEVCRKGMLGDRSLGERQTEEEEGLGEVPPCMRHAIQQECKRQGRNWVNLKSLSGGWAVIRTLIVPFITFHSKPDHLKSASKTKASPLNSRLIFQTAMSTRIFLGDLNSHVWNWTLAFLPLPCLFLSFLGKGRKQVLMKNGISAEIWIMWLPGLGEESEGNLCSVTAHLKDPVSCALKASDHQSHVRAQGGHAYVIRNHGRCLLHYRNIQNGLGHWFIKVGLSNMLS